MEAWLGDEDPEDGEADCSERGVVGDPGWDAEAPCTDVTLADVSRCGTGGTSAFARRRARSVTRSKLLDTVRRLGFGVSAPDLSRSFGAGFVNPTRRTSETAIVAFALISDASARERGFVVKTT